MLEVCPGGHFPGVNQVLCVHCKILYLLLLFCWEINALILALLLSSVLKKTNYFSHKSVCDKIVASEKIPPKSEMRKTLRHLQKGY